MPIGPQLPPHLQRAASTPRDDDSADEEDQDFGPSLPPHLAKLREQQKKVGPSLPSGRDGGSIRGGRSRSRSQTPPRHGSPSRRSPSRSDHDGASRAAGPQAPQRPQAGPQIGPPRPSRSPARTVGPARPGPSAGPSRPPGPARGPVGPSGPAREGYARHESIITDARPVRAQALPANEASDSSDDEVGPSLSDFVDPSAAPQKSAAELFREREARMAAAPKPEEVKVTKRDEWMLAPPSSGSLASLDPRQRPTSFQKSAKADVNLDVQREWTETPAERERRLREGASGSAPRARPEDLERKRARERDDAIRQGVMQHSTARGPSLMEQHKAKKSKTDEPEVIWDRDSMIGVGGLLSEDAREKKIKDARNLGDRFGHGKSGAYL